MFATQRAANAQAEHQWPSDPHDPDAMERALYQWRVLEDEVVAATAREQRAQATLAQAYPYPLASPSNSRPDRHRPLRSVLENKDVAPVASEGLPQVTLM